MPTAHSAAQLISYQHYLIAVGGVTYPVHQTQGSPIVNVEILDTLRFQWYIAESLLAHAYVQLQSVCVLDTLYLLDTSSFSSGFYRASLSTLISFATSKCEASIPTWERLPVQQELLGLVSYEGSLLAIGSPISQSTFGFSNLCSVIPSIHAYNADTDEWTNIGDLPTTFHVILSVVLPSREFVVLCRQYGTGDCEMYIGTPDYVYSTFVV